MPKRGVGDRKQSLRQRKGRERKRAIFGGLERLKLPLEKPDPRDRESPSVRAQLQSLLHIVASGSAGSPSGSLSESSSLAEDEIGPHPSAPGPLLHPGSKSGGHWAPTCRRPLLLLSRRLRAPGRNQPGCLAHAGTWASPRTGLCPCRVGLGLLT